MFEILRKQEYRKIGSDSDPYTRTHPLSKERIMHMRNHIAQSSIPSGTVPEEYKQLQQRMLGKLEGFLEDPKRVLELYPPSNNSVRAHYARAVAYHRQIEPDKAIAEIDALLAQSPDDPYFNELKGQILFESGQIGAAREAYTKAVQLLPDAPLIRAELGRVLLASEQQADLPGAIRALEYSTSADKRNPSAWRLLATAYGRDGRLGQSHLALAEEAILLNKPEQAITQLDIANNHILVGSPAQLRAQDLRQQALKLKKDKDKQS
jgi:predicted Zn-dependent protease